MADPLIEDYLRRLETAAAGLPPSRRSELLGEIHAHITDALASGEVDDQASLRTMLERLGDPHEIVAAARDDEPPLTPSPAVPVVVYRRPSLAREWWAVVLLTLGSALLVVGWLVGVALLWSSRRWTTAEKVLGTLLFPLGPFGGLVLGGLLGGQQCSTSSATDSAGTVVEGTTSCTGFAFPPAVGIPLLVAWVVVPFVVAGVLITRASRRLDTEPPVATLAGEPSTSRWGGLEVAAVLVLILAGLVLPVVGPAIGVLLVWLSSAWSRTQKWVATAICGSGLAVPLLFALLVGNALPGPRMLEVGRLEVFIG